MILHGVRHRSNQRHFVHPLRHFRQQFTHLDSVRATGNGLIGTPDSVRRVRLHIEHVDVTWPAPLEKENHRFRSGSRNRQRCRGTQQFRAAETEQPATSGLKDLSPSELKSEFRAAEVRRSRHEHVPVASTNKGFVSREASVVSCDRLASRECQLRFAEGLMSKNEFLGVHQSPGEILQGNKAIGLVAQQPHGRFEFHRLGRPI